ncbi:MAG: hypothetical protein KDB27_23560 [Planctomycetales bacterium]|nr:hypothetical protein [Planctomycetales bacterium]
MRSAHKLTFVIAALVFNLCGVVCHGADSIHVLIWDERQPRQNQAYDDYLGNEIAKRLQASTDDMDIRSVSLDDAEQGLGAGNLEWADVIVWWGHVRQNEITEATAKLIAEQQ